MSTLATQNQAPYGRRNLYYRRVGDNFQAPPGDAIGWMFLTEEADSAQEWTRLLNLIGRCEVSCLAVFWLPSLPFENLRDLGRFLDLLEECGTSFLSINEGIDTQKKTGRLMHSLIAKLANWLEIEPMERAFP